MWNWWGFWMPNSEKGSLISFIGSGGNIGVMIAFSLGGYLCIHGFDGGWPAIFYIFGYYYLKYKFIKIKFRLIFKRWYWCILVRSLALLVK
jgi:hypothetical protein